MNLTPFSYNITLSLNQCAMFRVYLIIELFSAILNLNYETQRATNMQRPFVLNHKFRATSKFRMTFRLQLSDLFKSTETLIRLKCYCLSFANFHHGPKPYICVQSIYVFYIKSEYILSLDIICSNSSQHNNIRVL